MRIVLILLALFSRAYGQSLTACRNPSNPGQQIICNNIFGWANLAKNAPVSFGQSTLPSESRQGAQIFSAGLATPLSAGGPPSSISQCMNWQCVCNFIPGGRYANNACQLPGGGTLSRRPRQEYRMMTDAARNLTLAAAHSNPMMSPGAHAGPSFCPWHRELLRRLEVAIRTAAVNGRYPFSTCTIPYLDNTMDADIYTVLGSEPTASVLFSNELLGSVQNGYLTDGPFANWAGRQGRVLRQLDRWPGQLLLMSRADVDNIMTSQNVDQVLAASAGGSECPPLPQNTLELIHGSPHVWIGGNMEQILTSTNDPAFFLHHCYIDFVWEGWRIRRQTPVQRETQYNTVPASCYSPAHSANAQMVPFPGLINRDGLSNIYTQIFYSYAARPSCSASQRNCGSRLTDQLINMIRRLSRFLWCYIPGGRCVSRVRPNQLCRIISSIDPCYQSSCSSRTNAWGRCRPTQRRQSWNETRPIDREPVPQIDPYPYETCFDNNPCCEFLSKNGGCKDPKISTECRASCKVCLTMKDYADDCEDRHHLCEIFKKDGFCPKHAKYMAENCRSTCNMCRTTRAQDCALGKKKASTKFMEKTAKFARKILSQGKEPSTDCNNQNVCCQYWKDTNGCDKMGVLQKQCAASCLCRSSNNLYSCNDFYVNCKQQRDEGKCKDPDVQENCRNTCGSCHTTTALRKLCG